jgi:hypothetical protein
MAAVNQGGMKIGDIQIEMCGKGVLIRSGKPEHPSEARLNPPG